MKASQTAVVLIEFQNEFCKEGGKLHGLVKDELARAMAKARRYAILAIFISTALLTPPDVISQILLALPMIALFEGGLALDEGKINRQRFESYQRILASLAD